MMKDRTTDKVTKLSHARTHARRVLISSDNCKKQEQNTRVLQITLSQHKISVATSAGSDGPGTSTVSLTGTSVF